MTPPPPGAPLGLGLKLGYASGSFGTGLFSTVPGLLLLIFLTDSLGVPPALAGWAVFLPRAWDVVTDPVMGALSDRTRSRWGRRRPWLLLGALGLAPSFVLLFSVPELSGRAAFAWVAAAYVLATTAFTVFQIPYLAMPAEMARSAHERTGLMSWRIAAMSLGILVGGAAAPLLVRAGGGGREGHARMAVVMASVCLASMLASFFGTARAPRTEHGETGLGFRQQAALAAANRPFFALLAGYGLQLVAASCLLAMVPYFARYLLGGQEGLVTALFVCLVVPAVLAMPAWVELARRVGRWKAWQLAVLLFALADLTLLFAAPGQGWRLYAEVTLMGVGWAGTQLFAFALLPDAIDRDHERSGLRREGAFTGLWMAGEKTGLALGVLLASGVLALSGFVESTSGRGVAQPASAVTGIRLAMGALPPLLLLASLPILRRAASAHRGGRS